MLKCGIDVGFGKNVDLTQFFSLCGMNVGLVNMYYRSCLKMDSVLMRANHVLIDGPDRLLW